jgi:hypothetical protein
MDDPVSFGACLTSPFLLESSSSLVRETSSYAHHPDHASSSDSSHSIDPIPRLLTPKPAELNRFADSATAATKKESPPPGGPVTQLSEADIRAFVQRALDGELEPSLGFERTYKVNQPPVGRPVRIYADGTLLSRSLITRRLKHACMTESALPCSIPPLPTWLQASTTSFTSGTLVA